MLQKKKGVCGAVVSRKMQTCSTENLLLFNDLMMECVTLPFTACEVFHHSAVCESQGESMCVCMRRLGASSV